MLYIDENKKSSHMEYTLYHVYMSTQQCTQECVHAYQYPVSRSSAHCNHTDLLFVVLMLGNVFVRCLFHLRDALWCYHMWICVIHHSEMWTGLMRCYHMWRFNITNSRRQDNEYVIRSRMYDSFLSYVEIYDLIWRCVTFPHICKCICKSDMWIRSHMQGRHIRKCTHTHTYTFT